MPRVEVDEDLPPKIEAPPKAWPVHLSEPGCSPEDPRIHSRTLRSRLLCSTCLQNHPGQPMPAAHDRPCIHAAQAQSNNGWQEAYRPIAIASPDCWPLSSHPGDDASEEDREVAAGEAEAALSGSAAESVEEGR